MATTWTSNDDASEGGQSTLAETLRRASAGVGDRQLGAQCRNSRVRQHLTRDCDRALSFVKLRERTWIDRAVAMYKKLGKEEELKVREHKT